MSDDGTILRDAAYNTFTARLRELATDKSLHMNALCYYTERAMVLYINGVINSLAVKGTLAADLVALIHERIYLEFQAEVAGGRLPAYAKVPLPHVLLALEEATDVHNQ